jgi:hypothetical protein
MVRIGRKPVDVELEKRIVTGLILSDSYCNEVAPNLKLSFFRSKFIVTLTSWVLDYYNDYQKAPSKHIQDIYNSYKDSIDENDSELIGDLLVDLSGHYEQDPDINVDYLVDKTYEYFDKNSLVNIADGIKSSLERNDLDKARSQLLSYHEVSRVVSGWIQPFADEDFMRKVLDVEARELFSFAGVIGEVMGPLRRNWLIGVMGPMKRGKTWWLGEFSIQGWLSRKNVAHIILEDEADEFASRLYKSATGLTDPGESGVIHYPVFDCESNQDGSCKMRERESDVALLVDYEKPRFEDVNNGYKPCSYCRNREGISSRYKQDTWFVGHERASLTISSLKKKMKSSKYLGVKRDNFFMKSYPAYSVNLSKVVADIELLEHQYGFVPDIITIDYADILAPEVAHRDSVRQVDETWKTLKQLAQVKHCLVVTGSQSTRAGMDKQTLKMKDTPDNIKKLAHVNAMFTLNQTETEKELGYLRFGVLVHRHRKFYESVQALVLQQPETGQTLIDSDIYRPPRRD